MAQRVVHQEGKPHAGPDTFVAGRAQLLDVVLASCP